MLRKRGGLLRNCTFVFDRALFFSAARFHPLVRRSWTLPGSSAALPLPLLRGCRLSRGTRFGGGRRREKRPNSPGLDGFRRRRSRATQVFFPLQRSLPRSFFFLYLVFAEEHPHPHLGLCEGRAVARAGGIVRAQDALEAQGDHDSERKLGEKRRF